MTEKRMKLSISFGEIVSVLLGIVMWICAREILLLLLSIEIWPSAHAL